MRAMIGQDEEYRLKKHFGTGLLCAAAGGMIALAAPFIPSYIKDASRLSAEFLYGSSVSAGDETADAPAVPADTHIYSVPKTDLDDSMMISYGYTAVPSAENEDPEYNGNISFIESAPDSTELISETDSGENGGKITDTLYGYCTGDNYIDLPGGGQVRNVTEYPNEELSHLADAPPAFEILADGSPEVLIIHTHTTESYEEFDSDTYSRDSISRTTDETRNVCAVGHEIALKLRENGIGVIHDTTLHDYPSYNGSYDRSRLTAEKLLKEYPGVKTVLDIHRDAIERDGERIAPTTSINGRSAAQIMIICGCGTSSRSIPGFRSNFSYACMLQSTVESEYPTLTRPVLFDYRFYNQDMTYGSLLIEVGGHANTYDEAVYSGQLFGQALADTLLRLKK